MKKYKVVLSVDTSVPSLSLALLKDGRIFSQKITTEIPQYSTKITPMVDNLLRKSGVDLSQIEVVAVNVGPGSFIGLRVGLSFAKILSKTLNLKIFAVDKFFLCLSKFMSEKIDKIEEDNFHVYVVFPAVKTEVYLKEFEVKNKKIYAKDERCVKISQINTLDREKVYFIGDTECLKDEVRIANTIKIPVSAKDILKLFVEQENFFKIGKFCKFLSPNSLSPLYVRHTYY